MSRKPLVVVTSIPRMVDTTLRVPMPNATAHRRFGELVGAAGGVAVVADASADPEALAERVDAVVVNGGIDVGAATYGATAHAQADAADERRDSFELALVRAAVDSGVPVLGVCRGMHVLNIALGGTLFQHLPDVTTQDHYVRDPCDAPAHAIAMEPGSVIAAALGASEAEVNSVHHQGLDRVADVLSVTARAADGTAEAVEDETGRLLGVQWHPEFLAAEYAESQVGVFSALVQAATTPR
jgi:gamma-glutamyl-gamma-aminobutyrate hydrolase PuuD